MKKIFIITTACFLMGLLYGQGKDPDPLRFQSEIKAFDSLDQCYIPADVGVLLVGSSSFRMWDDAENVFSGYSLLNRGFGGSHFSDVLFYFDKLITRYNPKTIILYVGDNDISFGKSTERVFNDFNSLVERIHSQLGTINIALVSIKPSPARWHMAEKMIEANTNMKNRCKNDDNLTFIDIWPLMLNASGRPDNELYIGDGIHMNQCGYKLWEKELLHYLETITNPD